MGLACLLALVGCSAVSGTGDKGYITGEGVPTEVEAVDRGKPVELTGTDLDGNPVDLADLRGKPVVVNVWWSECPPCRKEAPILQGSQGELAGGASIVGINIRDASKDNALAFERSFGVTYPSIYDYGSTQLLNFPPPYNPQSMPSTMVLDDQGRVAALIRGEIPSKTTLLELVEDVAAEDG